MSQQTVLHDAIRHATDPVAVLDRVVSQSLALIPAADGASLEVRRDATTLEYVCAAGTLADFLGLRLPVHGSFSGLAVTSGQVQRTDDARIDPRTDAAAVAKTGAVSMLCVPLSRREGSIAVLKLSARRPAAFTDEDADRLARLTGFLDATVRAAADLARATARVIEQLDRAWDDGATGDDAATARFVADVMTPGLADRIGAAALIDEVLAEDRLTMLVQPIVDLGSGRVRSCEALSRLAGPPAHPPDWWFAAAHATGRGVDLELAAVRRALAMLTALPVDVSLAVNVSAETVVTPALFALLRDVPPGRLTLELTEHDAVEDYPAVLRATGRFRDRGIRLSVDDTGSGYSGLVHVMQLLPDVIKLDRQLTTGIDDDPVKQAMATSIVSFAERIGADVIAEGIERSTEVDTLCEIGIRWGQGYLLGRPDTLDELLARLLRADGPTDERRRDGWS